MTLAKNAIVLHDIVAINSAIRKNAIAAIAIERIAQAAAKLRQSSKLLKRQQRIVPSRTKPPQCEY